MFGVLPFEAADLLLSAAQSTSPQAVSSVAQVGINMVNCPGSPGCPGYLPSQSDQAPSGTTPPSTSSGLPSGALVIGVGLIAWSLWPK